MWAKALKTASICTSMILMIVQPQVAAQQPANDNRQRPHSNVGLACTLPQAASGIMASVFTERNQDVQQHVTYAQTAASCFAGTGAVYTDLLPDAAACLRLRASTMVTAISMIPLLQKQHKCPFTQVSKALSDGHTQTQRDNTPL